MKNLAIAMIAAALLAGCGTTPGDRTLSGAGIGAGIGLLAGPPGVLVGAAIGGAGGAVTDPDAVNLGTPVWRRS
jgi:osmotically inducible lipoprotein OsmB